MQRLAAEALDVPLMLNKSSVSVPIEEFLGASMAGPELQLPGKLTLACGLDKGDALRWVHRAKAQDVVSNLRSTTLKAKCQPLQKLHGTVGGCAICPLDPAVAETLPSSAPAQRKMSGFQLFMKENKLGLGQETGQKWKALSAEDRESWQAKAKALQPGPAKAGSDAGSDDDSDAGEAAEAAEAAAAQPGGVLQRLRGALMGRGKAKEICGWGGWWRLGRVQWLDMLGLDMETVETEAAPDAAPAAPDAAPAAPEEEGSGGLGS
eukprot:Skav234081  [mRNA]  locus=scaffold3591:32306:45285:- [translate_table: standard]